MERGTDLDSAEGLNSTKKSKGESRQVLDIQDAPRFASSTESEKVNSENDRPKVDGDNNDAVKAVCTSNLVADTPARGMTLAEAEAACGGSPSTLFGLSSKGKESQANSAKDKKAQLFLEVIERARNGKERDHQLSLLNNHNPSATTGVRSVLAASENKPLACEDIGSGTNTPLFPAAARVKMGL